jgi:GxxExxY protein
LVALAGQDPRVEALAHAAIGAAIEVHRALGPGYMEAVYEDALAVEFGLREIPFSRQHKFSLDYKGHEVGRGRVDFLVAECLVVELKAVEVIAQIHRAQVISYLRALQLRVGLLLNFKSTTLRDGIERIVL